MSAVEMPSELERVRMALAEVGAPVSVADVESDGGVFFWGDIIPSEIEWRAIEVALVGDPECFACWDAQSYKVECLATRRFEQDCGVSR